VLEREKQRADQEKKHAAEKARREHPQKDVKTQASERQGQHAGMSTDPETAKDKDYAKRIEEKTKKH
jgi:hypothetical protein